MDRGSSTHRVVVLGAHFGGLAALHWLRRLAARRVSVVLVSPKPYGLYRPDLVFSAHADPAFVRHTRIALEPLCRRLGVELLIDYALGIDAAGQRVHLAHRGPLAYDTLFWATGMDFTWSLVPGLGPDAGFMCADYAARHLAGALGRFDGGEVALLAGVLRQDPSVRPALLCTCECALFEWLFLARDRLRRTGALARTRFVLVTAAASPGETVGPRARARLDQLLAEAGVEVLVGTTAVERTVDGITLDGPGGQRRLAPKLAVWMPPTAGSTLARESGLDDGWGWVPTNEFMQHAAWPNIYAVGDLNRASLPKHGHFAMVQARIAVRHWASEVLAARPGPAFRPATLGVFQLGRGRALLYFTDTLYGGEREVLLEGPVAYAMKQAFGVAYRWGRGGLPVMP
jgi:sulfide:quinone oxidoreductase